MISLRRTTNGFRRRWSGRRLVAVDLDSRQLRIVSVRRQGGRLRIEKLNCRPMPDGMDIADPKAVGVLLGEALEEMRLGSVGMVMSVPRGQAILKSLSLPPGTPPAEYASMVQFQMGKELPFRAEDAVIDFTTESHYDIEDDRQDAPGGSSVLVGAVRLQVVDYYRQLAQSAGVKLKRLGLRSYANRRCVEACTLLGRGERVAIVHVTSDETEIDVLVDGSLAFSRSAAVRVPPAGQDNLSKLAAAGAVVREVSLSLQSYHAAESGEEISRVLLAGGTGIEGLVAENLPAAVGVGCEMLKPSVALGLGEDESADTSAFIAALGLALDQTEAGDLPFDFLNPRRPPVQRDVRKIRIVAAAAGAAVILLAAVVAGGVWVHGKQAHVVALRKQRKDLEKEVRKVRALRKRVETGESWMSDRRIWLDHWAQLSGLFPGCTDVYITSLKSGSGVLDFAVRVRDAEVVSELGGKLDDAGYGFKPGQITIRTDPFGYQAGTGLKVILDPKIQVDLAAVKFVPRPSDDVSATTTRPPSSSAWPPRLPSRTGGSSRYGGGSSRSSDGPSRPTGSSRFGRDSRSGSGSRTYTPGGSAKTPQPPTRSEESRDDNRQGPDENRSRKKLDRKPPRGGSR